MTRALVAFGANLGDPAAMFAKVAERLGDQSGVASVVSSSLYETTPVGGPADQPAFLNGAFAVETTLGIEAFFARLRDIESSLGRERKESWGPRTIDLDLALFGDMVHSAPDLATPHPRFHFRRFVLAPAAEVAPNVVHPVLRISLVDLHRSAAGLTTGAQLLALVGDDPDETASLMMLLLDRHPQARVVSLPPSAIPATPLVHAGALIGVRPAVHLPGVEDRRLERDLDRVWDAAKEGRLWIGAAARLHPGAHASADLILPAVDLGATGPDGRRRELLRFSESLAEPVRR